MTRGQALARRRGRAPLPSLMLAATVAVVLVTVLAVVLAAAANADAAVRWRRVTIGATERCLPVAVTPEDQQRGLQGVKRVVRPLVFAFPFETMVAFWMKDTPAPLTGVWIGVGHRVIGFWHGRPESTVLHWPPAPVIAVVEYPAGARTPPLHARFAIGAACRGCPGGL